MALVIRREDRRNLVIGGALLLIASIMMYRAFFSGGDQPVAQAVSTRPAAPTSAPNSPFAAFDSAPAAPKGPANRSGVHVRNITKPSTTTTIDPKLKLDLMAKVEGTEYQGNGRNIFQYYTPPPPPPPKPITNPVLGPDGKPAAEKPAGPPPPPPPPPIPLKYYGYAHKPTDTVKRAFLLDGDEIHIAAEGDIVEKKYKILKIGVNTVEVEDTTNNHKQTLPLQENPQ